MIGLSALSINAVIDMLTASRDEEESVKISVDSFTKSIARRNLNLLDESSSVSPEEDEDEIPSLLSLG